MQLYCKVLPSFYKDQNRQTDQQNTAYTEVASQNALHEGAILNLTQLHLHPL